MIIYYRARGRLAGYVTFLFPLLTPDWSLAGVTGDISTENYLRMIWGLLVVLGIMLIIYGLVQKRFSLFTKNDSKKITIVEMKPLGGRKTLCLVSVKGKEFLLGISGDSITHLATLDESAVSFDSVLNSVEANKLP